MVVHPVISSVRLVAMLVARLFFMASGRHLSKDAGDFDRWDHAVENQRQGRMARIRLPDAGLGASGRPDQRVRSARSHLQ